MTVSVIDFFSGCGGTSLGFRKAGMKILGGIDNDGPSAETFRRNFPRATFLEKNIQDVSLDEVHGIMPTAGPTLFSGCAPCQPFSKQNRERNREDPRTTLLDEFKRFVVSLRPDFVVVENVPGLQKIGDRGPLVKFIAALRNVGYDVDCTVLAASNYGVPQIRKRLVLIAALNKVVPIPQPTHGPGRRNPSTVRRWIGNLPPLTAGQTHPDDLDHAAMSLSPINLQRIAATPEGRGRECWPKDLFLDCHADHTGHSDVYGRLSWDKPASAMTTRCLSYSNGRYGHPEQDRAISLREAACLQTFPRSFRFYGTLTSRGRQVGNAVPPLLARRIGEAILQVA